MVQCSCNHFLLPKVRGTTRRPRSATVFDRVESMQSATDSALLAGLACPLGKIAAAGSTNCVSLFADTLVLYQGVHRNPRRSNEPYSGIFRCCYVFCLCPARNESRYSIDLPWPAHHDSRVEHPASRQDSYE